MRRTGAVTAFLVVLLATPGVWSQRAAGELVCDGAILDQAWDLYATAQHSSSRREVAAFIVRDASGRYAFRRWMTDPAQFQASFHGVLPSGTLAIIHTHPEGAEYPSAGDRGVAEQMGLPVYVVTRWRISRTSGPDVETIVHGNWHSARRGHDSPCGPQPHGASDAGPNRLNR